MLIDLNDVKEMTITGMKHGNEEMTAHMYQDKTRKIIHVVFIRVVLSDITSIIRAMISIMFFQG